MTTMRSADRGSLSNRLHEIPRAMITVRGSSRLHTAIWQNHLATIEALLNDGVSPDVVDEESGWRPLHKALFWGRLQAAALLLAAGAHANLTDSQGRLPVQFLSEELHEFFGQACTGEVYTWGNGSNYQLGSGTEGLQETPARLEAMHGLKAVQVEAAKFHSMGLTKDGRLYTWGFGRGGRLGHADFLIHSGEAAVILPQEVAFFAKRKVVRIAASKHHSAAITNSGELFTWGSNRDGRLGYQAVDTQPIPRKVTTFTRMRVADVALANRHSVALLENGGLYSWGSNNQGQLGYGTSDSTSNALPRMVEAMKGKHIFRIAAAKRHTVVLTEEGNVYQWGHGIVIPRRVILAGRRDISRSSSDGKEWELVFHKGQVEVSKPIAVQIAAGAAHSSAVTQDGTVMCWRSMDPTLTPTAVTGLLAGKNVVKVSAGKYRTAAVTDTGDVYMWEGWSKAAEATPKGVRNPVALGTSPPQVVPAEWDLPKGAKHRRSGKAQSFQVITPVKVENLVRVSDVAVGEKHSIALSTWCSAPEPFWPPEIEGDPASGLQRSSSAVSYISNSGEPQSPRSGNPTWSSPQSMAYWDVIAAGLAKLDSARDEMYPSMEQDDSQSSPPGLGIFSLQKLCEICVAVNMVEPRSVLQVLEYADAAGADLLKQHCLGVCLSNLDLILLEAASQLAQLSPHLLFELETLWTHSFPRSIQPTASDEDSQPLSQLQSLEKFSSSMSFGEESMEKAFRHPEEEAEASERSRQERTVRKKLQQIEILEARAQSQVLDDQQRAKLSLKPILEAALQAILSRRPLKEIKQVLSDAQASVIVTTTLSQKAEANGASDPNLKLDIGKRSRKLKKRSSQPVLETNANDEGSTQPPHSGEGNERREVDQDLTALPSATSVAIRQSAMSTTPKNDTIPQTVGFDVAKSSSVPLSPARTVQTGFNVITPAPQKGNSEVVSAAFATPGPQPRAPTARAEVIKESSAKKSSKRRGGLSMFLAGDLDVPEKQSALKPPAGTGSSHQAASSKPAAGWATTMATPQAKPQPSLRDILSQQSQESMAVPKFEPVPKSASKSTPRSQRPSDDGHPAAGPKGNSPVASAQRDRIGSPSSLPKGGISIALGDFVKKTAPQPIAQAASASKAPAWGGVPFGTSPSRLQDIQAEEESKLQNSARSWTALGSSPSQRFTPMATWQQTHGTEGSGSPGVVAFPAGSSPSLRRANFSSHVPQSKWYIKEETEIVALRSIQTEETALKELSEFMSQKEEEERKAAEERRQATKKEKRKRARNRKPKPVGDGDKQTASKDATPQGGDQNDSRTAPKALSGKNDQKARPPSKASTGERDRRTERSQNGHHQRHHPPRRRSGEGEGVDDQPPGPPQQAKQRPPRRRGPRPPRDGPLEATHQSSGPVAAQGLKADAASQSRPRSENRPLHAQNGRSHSEGQVLKLQQPVLQPETTFPGC